MKPIASLSTTSFKFLVCLLLFFLLTLPLFNTRVDVLAEQPGVCYMCAGWGIPGSGSWWLGCALKYDGHTHCHTWEDGEGYHCEADGQECHIAF